MQHLVQPIKTQMQLINRLKNNDLEPRVEIEPPVEVEIPPLKRSTTQKFSINETPKDS